MLTSKARSGILRRYLLIACLGYFEYLGACRTTVVPRERLAAQRQVLAEARTAGAESMADASLYLSSAEDQLRGAERLFEAGDPVRAHMLLSGCELDARLALVLAQAQRRSGRPLGDMAAGQVRRAEVTAIPTEALFDIGQGRLSQEGTARLDGVATDLLGAQTRRITVQVIDSAQQAPEMARARAEAVKGYLVTRGVRQERLQVLAASTDLGSGADHGGRVEIVVHRPNATDRRTP